MIVCATDNKQSSQHGFTIVEFMIATTVFGIVLMIVTFSIMHISKIYQRSINTSRTQAVARNILDNVSQSIQYSGGSVTFGAAGGTTSACMGITKQFLYIKGVRRATSANSVMSTRQINDPDCTAVDIQSTLVGQQLIPVNMRLSELTMTQIGTSGLYQVYVKVAYGEDGDLENPSLPTAVCRQSIGAEFCAISELATTVQRRL